ncbi:MAG: type II toxin-antitoxin system VapC family toxin [Pseudomonadota bacterium]
MKLLLDTHALLWWLADDPSLPGTARSLVANSDNLVFPSAAVVWEIRIKQALGKLEIPADFHGVLGRQPFTELPISVEHAHAIADLPMHHRDPFDRILVAQAKLERMTIVTRDPVFKKYGVHVIIS